jgi:hypothetical protein
VIKIDLTTPATLELRSDWWAQRLQGPDTIRFDTAADAIKFAVESRDQSRLNGARLTTGNGMLTLDDMRVIYERPDFPLSRTRLRWK